MIRCRLRSADGYRCTLEHGHSGPHQVSADTTVQPCPACGHAFSPMKRLKRAHLEAFIAQAVGEASSCWDNLQGAGVFDDQRANAIVDKLLDCFEAHQVQLFED